MAAEASLPDLLSSLTTATNFTIQGLPASSSLLSPEHGISLLDVKNEIFLSYLQALALRNLNVIRSLKDGGSLEDVQELSDSLTSKLMEHRVYLERGVRPLERKIKYQADKAVKTADDEERVLAHKSKAAASTNGHTKNDEEDSEDSREESNDASDASVDVELEAAAYRPNVAAFAQVNGMDSEQDRRSKLKVDGVYRPPRFSATSMPTTETRERKERKAGRSATLDEYVSNELSSAPLAEPSIGSTIAAGGRMQKDARQLAREQERRDYEETHLMRLPKESKKEQAKQSKQQRNGGFGGEEWRELGRSVDRITDLTRRKGKDSTLEKSRKRRAVEVEDGPRGDGIGDAFNVKKRRLMKKMRR